jgi:multiple sugar transport system substrate-binding protein
MTIMAQPEILPTFLEETGALPTEHELGDGASSDLLNQSIPFFKDMVSMIPYGKDRPNIPEYPQIAEDIHQAIQQVYNGSASPQQALSAAAAKSADTLGWK